MRFLVVAGTVLFIASSAQAETFPVIKNQVVLKECGECHMAFPPQTLPKAVWKNILANLSSHFGEDASISPAVAKEVLAYHVSNASDVSSVRAARKWRANGSFQRIVDAPRFKRKHGRCSQAVWSYKKINSKANCLACHPGMQKSGSTNVNLRFLPANLRKQCGEGED